MAGVFPDRRSRRIVVGNIPTNARVDKLVIYFQKKKNGGSGDVVSITFPKSSSEPDQAVVEFENPKTLDSLMQHNHVFAGQQLSVTVFPEQSFGKSEVALSEEVFKQIITSDHLQKIEECTGVTIAKRHQGYCVTGEWYQVSAAVQQIEQVTTRKPSMVSSSSLRHGSSSDTTKLSSSGVGSGAIPKLRRRRQSSGGEAVFEIPVDDSVYAYMKICHTDLVKSIEKKYKVKIREMRSKVIFAPTSKASESEEAAKVFHGWFAKFENSAFSTKFDLKDLGPATEDEICSAISQMNKSEKIFVSRNTEERDSVVFLAMSPEEAESAVKNFKSMFAPEKAVLLKTITVSRSDLNVLVLHADFRKGKTDAILSSVDLSGKGHVVSQCREYIKSDVRQWLSTIKAGSRSNLVHMTRADDSLDCKRIIHFYINNLFQLKEAVERALLMCLEFAHEKRVPSITLPVNYLVSADAPLKINDLNSAIFIAIQSFQETHTSPNVKEIEVVHSNLAEAERLASRLEVLSDFDASSEAGTSSNHRSKTEEENEPEVCPVCLDDLVGAASLKTLPCSHVFHQACIDKALSFSKKCPMCMRSYGKQEGIQPRNGIMHSSISQQRLPGFTCDTIVIVYNIPNGVQGPEHPNPGQRYFGTSRTAYLPNNAEGREVLLLLRKAFEARLTFTIGRSVTSGRDNCVTWNDIHHKTNIYGGPSNFGYPDPTYLTRLRMELADKGIVRDMT